MSPAPPLVSLRHGKGAGVSPVVRDRIEILLIQADEYDVAFTRGALREARVRNVLHVEPDGKKALELLHRGTGVHGRRPDLVLLDLALPKSSLKLLAAIKSHASLKRIPVVLIATSRSTPDLLRHQVRADGFVTKPVDLDQLLNVVRMIEGFWLEIVKVSPV